MLRLIVISISLLVYTSSYAQRIKGSDTVLPLAQAVAETYMDKYPQRTVTVTGGGSGVGISSIMEGTTDIAMSSRPIKFSEKIKLKKCNNELEEVIVAYCIKFYCPDLRTGTEISGWKIYNGFFNSEWWCPNLQT